ncbi:putative mRNA-capping enzyme [Golden Marseillevirus]|uniref:putative mRNA-capping enzyme n=1 Tax=Golden Marseillevirus TaxID=1720526 RepID=UPI000877A8A0|nr:putative mRNA-capping enzyme [Golden Marseillevirus]ALX27582.1 putative mRNA-capping enzyme [Golden Marseillevirus]
MSDLSQWFESNEVAPFLVEQPDDVEVELSFGRWKKEERQQVFQPGVTKAEFYNLFEFFSERSKIENPDFRREDFHTKEETMKVAGGGQRVNIRRITDLSSGKVSYQKKERNKIWDERTWGIRIASSRENDVGTISDFVPSGFREKQRTRFTYIPNNSVFKGLILDLTKVVKSSFRNGVVYEVEIEKMPSVKKSASAMKNVVHRILQLMQSKNSLRDAEVIPVKQKEEVLEAFARLMDSKRQGDTSFLNKPRQVKIEDLFEPRLFAVTNKLDGERRLLWFGETGTYLVNPPSDIQKIGGIFYQYKDTVLDVELYGEETSKPKCYAFDCLFFMGKKQYNNNFDTRFAHVLEIEKHAGEELGIVSKKYFEVSLSLGSFEGMATATKDTRKLYLEKARTKKLGGDLLRDAVDAALDYAKVQKFRTDGLILQPREQGYKNEDTLKWKPAELMTIDFRLKRKSDNEYLLMMGGPRDKELNFLGSGPNRVSGTVKLPDKFLKEHQGRDFEGEILEFGFDKKKNIFFPHRIRTDKDVPNYMTTVLSVWGNIFRGISLETMRGETLVLARRYNNILKQCLLTSASEAKTVLDIGSGRGGDIPKWQKGGMGMVWSIEPNKENIKEYEERAKAAKFTKYKILNAKAQDTQAAIQFFGEDKSVDLSSAFYCLGYFGETKKDLDALCLTMSSLSKQGSLALFSFMDGDNIQRLLGKNKKFENSAFSVEKIGQWGKEAFGRKVRVDIKDADSMVKEQTEWLVDIVNAKGLDGKVRI